MLRRTLILLVCAGASIVTGQSTIPPFCNAPIPAGWSYCICTDRAANDMMFSSFSMSPATPTRDDNVVFTYTAAIDMDWGFSNGNAGVDTTLYVDGTPRTRKFFNLFNPQFSGLSDGAVGPTGSLSFTLSTGQWGEIGGTQLFYEQTFYAPYSGDTLLCIRTKPVNSPLV